MNREEADRTLYAAQVRNLEKRFGVRAVGVRTDLENGLVADTYGVVGCESGSELGARFPIPATEDHLRDFLAYMIERHEGDGNELRFYFDAQLDGVLDYINSPDNEYGPRPE